MSRSGRTLSKESQDAEVFPELPLGWCWATLDELASPEANAVTDGPFGSNLKTEHYTDAGPRVIRLQNIGDGQFKNVSAHVSEEHFQRLQKHRVFGGELVIAALGEALPRSCVIPDWLGPAIVKADCVRFKPNSELVSPNFLSYALNNQETRRRTSRIIHGVGRPRLNLAELKSIRVPLAPANEQRRVVEKVEELLSDLDAGVAALKRARANLNKYRAAVLKAAVTGDLTADWRAVHPHVEPATKLLDHILAGRRGKWEAVQQAKFAGSGKTPPKNWQDKYPEPTQPETTGALDLPRGWCWVTVEQVSEFTRYGSSAKTNPDLLGVPVARMGNIQAGRLVMDDVKYLPHSHHEFPDLLLEPGDLLLNRTNSAELVGKSAVYCGQPSPCSYASYLIAVRCLPGCCPDFVAYFINSTLGRLWVKSVATQQCGQANVNGTKLQALSFPLPPQAEQEAIVAEVEERFSVIAATEDYIAASLKRADRLRQSILKVAFTGQLVPQDPNDEPADVLLARIRRLRSGPAVIVPAVHPRPQRQSARRREPQDIVMRRGALACYIVDRLHPNSSFGRTQLVKALHLTQCHVGVDLKLTFERHQMGPLDTRVYKVEAFAKKQGWFSTANRRRLGVTYHPGLNIDERCRSAVDILADKRTEMDRLLTHFAAMNTDQAELFSTVFAAWNDLLIDARPTDNAAIVNEVYAWHESKRRFGKDEILARIAWMRENGYVPTGAGTRTQALPDTDAGSAE